MGVSSDLVVTFRETQDWLDCMRANCGPTGHALQALAVLGEGNERYILREYVAIERAFKAIASTCWPHLDYQPFLRANVEEDSVHSRILRGVAAQLIHGTTTAREFEAASEIYFEAAKAGIEMRNRYYDALAERTERFLRDPSYLGSLAHERPQDVQQYRAWTAEPLDVLRSVQDFIVADCGQLANDQRSRNYERFDPIGPDHELAIGPRTLTL